MANTGADTDKDESHILVINVQTSGPSTSENFMFAFVASVIEVSTGYVLDKYTVYLKPSTTAISKSTIDLGAWSRHTMERAFPCSGNGSFTAYVRACINDEAIDPEVAMTTFVKWYDVVASNIPNGRLIRCSNTDPYDCHWLSHYLDMYTEVPTPDHLSGKCVSTRGHYPGNDSRTVGVPHPPHWSP